MRPTTWHDKTTCTCKGEYHCDFPDRVPLVTFGLGGHMLYCASKKGSTSTLSGYEDPESFERRVQQGDYDPRKNADSRGYSHGYFLAGAWVIDEREVVTKPGGAGICWKAPLCDAMLADDVIDRCPEPSNILASALMVPGNAFGGMLAMQINHRTTQPKEPGPLDSVSPARLVEYWRGHGARIGKMSADGNTIIWEDA